MIYIASDHGGFLLKEKIKKLLEKQGYAFVDLGTNNTNSVSYVDFANLLCKNVLDSKNNKGILICKSGIGMSIASNRHIGIRAGLCYTRKSAEMCRKHNNCNVLVLKGKSLFYKKIVKTFLKTSFEGGRHLDRINSIDK